MWTKKLAKYRRDGPRKTTAQLMDAMQSVDIQGMTLLDIGGGVGDIQHGLPRSGVSRAINIEGSTSYTEACQGEAERQGHANRIHHMQGNFVELAGDIPRADIVTLDRVICCYDDMPRLVNLPFKRQNKFYAVVYPRNTWWIKLGVLIYYKLRHWLLRMPMRYFIHSTRTVEAIIRKKGMERHFHREMGPWQVVVFSRQ